MSFLGFLKELVTPKEEIIEYCNCADWEVCGCGNQPPHHCIYCCRDLTPEQMETEEFKRDVKLFEL